MGVPEGAAGDRDAFERIERAVAQGRTDLGALGFWRLLAEVKADPERAARAAEVAGRIDRAAFERAVSWRVPVWVGNGLLVLGTLAGAGAVALAFRTTSEPVAGLALLVAGGVWSVTFHDLAHWLVGRAAGIRFTSYFVGWRPPPPRPGLKTDYATYLRVSPTARVWMHASGAIATKVAPFIALAFVPATDAPPWAGWGLLGLGIVELATDALFSVRSSDWKKVRRELRLARRVAGRR